MNRTEVKKSIAQNGDMEKINALSRRELKEDEVYIFTAALCDNDIDRDFERFSVPALSELALLFMGKTGIFDHSMKSSDQKARIFDTFIEKSDEKCIDGAEKYVLKARAYMLKSEENSELINEIDAGIKKEISVSCTVERKICSICGADNKKEPCSHRAGEYYGDKLCYKTLENALDAYEFSFVAVPAQRGAGVTKAFNVTKEKTVDDIIKTIKRADGEVVLSVSEQKKLSAHIEELEESASIGEEYKSKLMRDVIKLLSLKLTGVEKSTLSSVVSVMTVKELLSFKKGLEEKAQSKAPQLLNRNEKPKSDYSQFRI
ncbi:MAG: hypothetical protein IJT65_05050 [Eubacterium sp.]|nr:hypothetical protein [Eubacterium sp.]